MTPIFGMIFDRESFSWLDYLSAQQIALYYTINVAVLGAMALALALVYSTVMNGSFIVGFRNTFRGLAEGLHELITLPLGWRRIWAIAMLTLKECLRRRVLFVFVLFLLPFLVAGWYLDQSPREGRMISYIAFVNIAMVWLLLPLVLFLASFSFPNDLQSRTIQTVATKPIRRSELLVGRIAGFMIVFTGVLAVMGGVSLAYLTANATPADRLTTWTARVPVYAVGNFGKPQVYFVKENVVGSKGTNVGKEWGYRSHIQGATDDSAHWVFKYDPGVFANAADVRVQATFNIFKTTKGDPAREDSKTAGVWGKISVADRSNKGAQVFTANFRVNNARINEIKVPSKFFASGDTEVVVTCLTRNQFIGMAGPDLYLLAAEKSFAANFFKSLIGLWLKLLFIVSVAVAASTVLKGFITVLFTVMVYVLGFFYNFMYVVSHNETVGGGPIESLIRIFKQTNQVNPLDETFVIQGLLAIDRVLLLMMRALSNVVPNLETLDLTNYVAQGFNIPTGLIGRDILLTIGYVAPVIVAGCFLLRNRELAV